MNVLHDACKADIRQGNMNILFIEKACDGTVGGSHTCLFNLVSRLDRNKYNIWVVIYEESIFATRLKEIRVNVVLLSRNVHYGGATIIRKIRNWYNLVYKHKRLLKLILLKNNINLVVINNSISGSGDYVDVCTKEKIPLISYERGYYNYTKFDVSLTSKINRSIAVSYAIKQNMEHQGYASNIDVIYDGIPLQTVKPSDHTLTKAKGFNDIGIPDGSIVIGIVGNIRRWKGQEYFVKAFNLLAAEYDNIYGLVIGGYGSDDIEYFNSINNIIHEPSIRKRLIFTGFRQDVAELLKIMDISIHASIEPEPFGMVILEAMLQKVPVIATNFGGPVETLANGECGILIPPGNEQEIVDAVKKYLNNAEFRTDTINRAFERVMTDFDVCNTVRFVDALFQEACLPCK